MYMRSKWIIGTVGAILTLLGTLMIVAGLIALRNKRYLAKYNRIWHEMDSDEYYSAEHYGSSSRLSSDDSFHSAKSSLASRRGSENLLVLDKRV